MVSTVVHLSPALLCGRNLLAELIKSHVLLDYRLFMTLFLWCSSEVTVTFDFFLLQTEEILKTICLGSVLKSVAVASWLIYVCVAVE